MNSKSSDKNLFSENQLKELIYTVSSGWQPIHKRTPQELMAKLHERIETKELKKTSRRFLHIGSIAASIVVLLSISFFIGQKNISTQIAEQKHVQLPDGSTCTLDADSKLSYNKLTWYAKRKLKLEGKARFEVKKGRRFKVHTSKSNVQVLGTIFDVEARQTENSVKCYEGKVSVSTIGEKDEYILEAGEMIKQVGNKIIKSKMNPKNEKAWTEGIFHFNNSNFQQVINEVERHYNVEIKFSGDTSRLFTGYFVAGDLEASLQMICLPMNFQHKKEGNKILICPHN